MEVCGSLRGNDCEKDRYDVEENNQEKEENLVKLQTLGKKDEFVVDKRVASKGFVRCKNFVGNNNFESQVHPTDLLFAILLLNREKWLQIRTNIL